MLLSVRKIAPAIACAALLLAGAVSTANGDMTPVETGIDRSNMGTEWTLSPPSEPNVAPFNGPYNGAGVFEARRIAVYDGIARLHAQWFRDGFSADTPADAQLFADAVKQVHARGMKILAVVGPTAGDFAPADRIAGVPSVNGCAWSTAPLSKIKRALLEHRLRTHFDAVKSSGETVDAFEIGNELDLYCNDADMPLTSDFGAHQWKWFLSAAQVHAFALGYAPFLKTFADLARAYFPHVKIITFGMSNPTGNSAPLIAALAHLTDRTGTTFDYTTLVDGYGTHLYPSAKTTNQFVQGATAELSAQAATLAQRPKPLWITEWNEAGSAFWSSHVWPFQYDARGNVGGDLNLAAAPYPAMTRAQTIRAFQTDVIDRLRSAAAPVGVAAVLYYSYDSAGKSAMCDKSAFNRARGITGECYSGVIDPVTGDLLPDVAAAVTRTAPSPGSVNVR